jgi:dihydrofolate reductase
MGRKTYDSLPAKSRPLPNRRNVVVSRSVTSLDADVEIVSDPEVFVSDWRRGAEKDQVLWIIGGGEIYKRTLGLIDELYLTKVSGRHRGDTFFPEFENEFELVGSESSELCIFQRWVRKS